MAKGDQGGECNRGACKGHPATWYNHSTERWYCIRCATLLNRIHEAESKRLYGHALLTEEGPAT